MNNSREFRVEKSYEVTKKIVLANNIIDKVTNFLGKGYKLFQKIAGTEEVQDEIIDSLKLEIIVKIAEVYEFNEFFDSNSCPTWASKHLLRQLKSKFLFIPSNSYDVLEHLNANFIRRYRGENKILIYSVIGLFEYYKELNKQPDKIFFKTSSQEYINEITTNFGYELGKISNPNKTGEILAEIASNHVEDADIVRERRFEMVKSIWKLFN